MTLRKHAALIGVLAIFVPLFACAQNSSDTIRCSIQSMPGTVAAGEQVKLTWSSFGAKSASIEGIGSVQTSGTRTVTPAASQKYTLTVVSSKNQPYSCETFVTVVAARPSCFISVWPMSITEGQNATVSWGSSHATSLFITDLGSVPPSGTRSVRPSRTATYALTATGANGTCTETAHLTVHKAQSNYGYFPNVIQTLAAPFIPQSNRNTSNNNATTYEDTWYFDDTDDEIWDDYYDDSYADDSYGDFIEDDYYYDNYNAVYDDSYDTFVEDTYYGEGTYDEYVETYDAYDEVDDCWWDYWCGNSSLNDSVQETYEEWGTNFDQGVGYNETYYDYAENYYFQDTIYYDNGTVDSYEEWW